MKRLSLKKAIFLGISLSLVITIITFRYVKLQTNRPNIILIVIDALRADHLGCYGYPRKTSPNIDSLAKSGTIFLNNFAVSSYTVQSIPALLTGRYLGIFSAFEDTLKKNNILDKQFITLGEYLKNLGYISAAFLENETYRWGTGFEQGFDIYEMLPPNPMSTTNKVISFLDIHSKNKPFFIFVHYLGVHAPYNPPKNYLEAFENDSLYKQKDKLLTVEYNSDTNPYVSRGTIPPIVFKKDKYNANYYIACYDAKIRDIDSYIGQLLNYIDSKTLIILTADHGQSMGEHNVYFSHGANIYDELLHVPLIIKDGRYFKNGKKISAASSSVDIVPTILSIVKHPLYFLRKNRLDGKDLRMITSAKDIDRKYIYAYRFFEREYNIRDVNRNVKYIVGLNKQTEELYFLPDEYKNYIKDSSLNVSLIKEQLRKELRAWLKHYPIRADINPQDIILDGRTKERLKSLGYIN